MTRLSKLIVVIFLIPVAGSLFGPALLKAQPPAAPAATADAGPFGALRWRSIGPPRGGRSIAVAGSTARSHEYYMGATGGGLWKTVDAA